MWQDRGEFAANWSTTIIVLPVTPHCIYRGLCRMDPGEARRSQSTQPGWGPSPQNGEKSGHSRSRAATHAVTGAALGLVVE